MDWPIGDGAEVALRARRWRGLRVAELLDETLSARLSGVKPRHERQLEALVRVSRALGTASDQRDLIRTIVRQVTLVFDAERTTFYLHDPQRDELWSEVAEGLEAMPSRLRVAEDQGICGHVFRTRSPLCLPDVLNDPRFARAIADQVHYYPRSMLVVPVGYRADRCDGVLQVMDRRAGHFSSEDIPLMEAIAVQVAISLENSRLHVAQTRQFESFIRALSAALDARDPLTAIHSINVANYAMGVAVKLRLDAGEIERIRIAGLLHDIGKIGVREVLLTKPGALSADEFEEMKQHAAHSRTILSQIEFIESLKGVDFVAAAHHEKLDGSGYPDGLQGDAIPTAARILAVADIYDALTQTRHYRQNMSAAAALAIIDEMTPEKLDARCVAALKRFLGVDGSGSIQTPHAGTS